MALAYTTGTISQPDAGSVGLAMVDKIRDDVVAHAAWELVEEYTAGSGTCRWTVLKCLAAASGLSADYFVIISRTLATGELRFFICEGYSAGSHLASFYARTSSSSTTFDSLGRDPSTFTLGTTPTTSSGTQPSYINWTPSGTSTKWWIIVDSEGFSVAFNGASNGFFHIGAYTPLIELANTLPVQIIGLNSQTGMITRNPAVAGVTSVTSTPALMIRGGGSTLGAYGPPLGFQGDLRYSDKLQNGMRPVAEQGIVMEEATDSRQQNGWALGKQKRMRIGITPPVGVAFGDAYAMNGTLWVPYLPTDARVWDTGVASV
jgi:hypothetical protein